MKEVADIDGKITERRSITDYEKRQDAMEIAWRRWRNSVIEAMAARVKAVGDKHDEELELLIMELQHTNLVRRALRSELGIDADKYVGKEGNEPE